jgi:hypothetical protein
MGVMLSLDRERPSKGRRPKGQHVRHRRDAERAQPLAARPYDAPASGRLLARLARAVLTRKDPLAAGTRAAGAAAAGVVAARPGAAGTARSRPRRDGAAQGGSAPAA